MIEFLHAPLYAPLRTSLYNLGWTLIQFLWQGTVITLIHAAVRGWLLRSIGSPARYTMACVALAAMAIAPVVTFFYGPSIAAGTPVPAWPLASADAWNPLLPAIAAAWFLGASLFSIRLIGGWRYTVRMRSTNIDPAPEEWQQKLAKLIERLRVSRPVALAVSTMVEVPTVVGWLKPAILIPAGALTGMPPELLEALLAHELAHVRRLDYAVNLLQSAAEALLFFHPGVWWISGQIRAERELCCDDIAVAATGNAFLYARALAELETFRLALRAPVLAASGSQGSGPLVARIRRLIQKELAPEPVATPLPGTAAIVTIALLWLAGMGAAISQAAPDAHAAQTPSVTTATAPLPASSAPALPTPKSASTPAPATVAEARVPSPASLLLSPFGPQPPKPQAEAAKPAAPKPGTLKGIITDKATGKPVPKATVRIRSEPKPEVGDFLTTTKAATTADDGSYTIEGIEAGDYTVSVSARSYTSAYYGTNSEWWHANPMTFTTDGARKSADFSLIRQGVISVRVVNRRGEPVPGLMIDANQPSYPGGKKRLNSASTDRTNDLGECRLTGLNPGTYYLSALPLPPEDRRTYAAGLDRSATPPRMYMATFYPGVSDDNSAAPVELIAGQEAHIEMTMLEAPAGIIRGRVTNLSGKPMSEVQMELQREGAFEGVTGVPAILNADGSFDVTGIPQGRYALSVSTPLGESRRIETTVPVVVGDKPIEKLDIRLTKGVRIPGKVRADPPDDPLFRLPLGIELGWSGIVYATRLPAGASTDQDGAFTFEGVNAGDFHVNVHGLAPRFYIKSATLGGVDVLENGVTITEATAGSLDIVVSSKGGKLTGMVRDEEDKASGFATVVLVPEPENRRTEGQWYKTSDAKADGAYDIRGIIPGSYKLYAFKSAPMQSWMNAEFMRPCQAQGIKITIRESSSESVDLKVIP